MEVELDLEDEPGGSIGLQLDTMDYTWEVLLPVIAHAPTLALGGATSLKAGAREAELDVESSGFTLADPLLKAASPDSLLFVESIAATGPGSAILSYDTAVRESAESATVFVMPEPTPWAVPLDIEFAAADVLVLVPPSSVSATIPGDGPDLVGFTPASGDRMAVWSVLDSGSVGPDWRLLDGDGISVLGRNDGTTVTALLGAASTRTYMACGGADMSGTDYWASVDLVLPSALHEETEPNDTYSGREGIPGPAGLEVLADMGPADLDFYGLTYTGSAPACYEVISTRWTAGTYSSPYMRMALIDATGSEVQVAIGGGPGGTGRDPMLCTSGSAVDWAISLEGLAGTTGPYMLVGRWPLIVSELDHTVSFVELSGKPGLDLTGYRLDVLSGGGAVLGSILLTDHVSMVPLDGFIVLATPGSVPGAEVEDTVLGLMSPPYVVQICHAAHSTCDKVAVGSSTYGEGGFIPPADMPAGRLWGMDTDDNARDFTRLTTSTPGTPNALPAP
jgi:hypothetical protein